MATATHTTAGSAGRRGTTFAAVVMTADLRAAIVQKAEQLLDEARAAMDGAAYLIEFLDAADRPIIDLEPDYEGEAEPDEASAAPITLVPDWVRPVETIRPTTAEQRAAYIRTGGTVPRNLRRGFWKGCRA